MADVIVKNSPTGTMGTIAAKRTRYEKMETAYGQIPSEAFEIGDTLVLDQIPMKELIFAKFKAGTTELEILPGADISSAIVWDLAQTNGVTADIDYVVEYIRGTGRTDVSVHGVGEGQKIELTVKPPVAVAVAVTPTPIAATTATLKGTVDPNGAAATTVVFEYGIETGVYTVTTDATQSPLAWATTAQNVSIGLTGLTAETEYFFRVKATTVSGIVYSDELSFTTAEA